LRALSRASPAPTVFCRSLILFTTRHC